MFTADASPAKSTVEVLTFEAVTQVLRQWTLFCKTDRPTITENSSLAHGHIAICCKTFRPTCTRQQQPGPYTQDLWLWTVCCKTVRPTGTRQQQLGLYTQDLWLWTVCCKTPTYRYQATAARLIHTRPLTVDRLLQDSDLPVPDNSSQAHTCTQDLYNGPSAERLSDLSVPDNGSPPTDTRTAMGSDLGMVTH